MEAKNENLSDNNIINSIKEMLLDEEKIVTYISLSKDLCIHVNTSKLLLRRALETIRKEQSNLQLSINYIISGLSDVNMGRTTVCNEQDLDHTRKIFKTIFYEHVYSISKGIPSNAAILLLNKFEDFGLCKGCIKSSDCTKQTTADVSSLKNTKMLLNTVNSKPIVGTTQKLKQECNETATAVCNDYKESNNLKESNTEKKNISATSAKIEITSKNQTNAKQSTHKTKKGIAGFFNKPVTACNNSTITKTAVEIKEKIIKVEKMDAVEKEIVSESYNNKTEKENTNISNIKIKTLSQIKKTSKVDKKRKRVLQVSDSDSEEETDPFTPDKQNVIEESDDEIPPTPMANNIKITAALVNPKKKRKIVDKTFMDEEGYILTKKVEVYESCSEHEEEVSSEKTEICKEENLPKVKVEKVVNSPTKKNRSKIKKIASPQKGKQAILTNFFKRK